MESRFLPSPYGSMVGEFVEDPHCNFRPGAKSVSRTCSHTLAKVAWFPKMLRTPSRKKKTAESFYHSLQKKGKFIEMSLKIQSTRMSFEYVIICQYIKNEVALVGLHIQLDLFGNREITR